MLETVSTYVTIQIPTKLTFRQNRGRVDNPFSVLFVCRFREPLTWKPDAFPRPSK